MEDYQPVQASDLTTDQAARFESESAYRAIENRLAQAEGIALCVGAIAPSEFQNLNASALCNAMWAAQELIEQARELLPKIGGGGHG